MTISKEYKSLLQTLLVNGYENIYYYYYGYSSTAQKYTFVFNFPTGIAMISRQNGVPQAMALAKITSIVENGDELSITFEATFTTNFNADEIDMYAVIGNSVLYKIASVTGIFQSSVDDNLSVEWTIEIIVNSIFNVGQNTITTYILPINNCKSLNGQLIIYPYFVHLIIAYTLIPSTAFTVQSQFPNIPLAIMLANVPTPSSPQQLKGITAFIYTCNGEPQLCYPVYDGLGTAIITSNINCNSPTMIVLYQIGNVYLAYMQLPVSITFNIGNTYNYEIGVNVS
jgi:hypothetical protein